jgi:hypothetical protein
MTFEVTVDLPVTIGIEEAKRCSGDVCIQLEGGTEQERWSAEYIDISIIQNTYAMQATQALANAFHSQPGIPAYWNQ